MKFGMLSPFDMLDVSRKFQVVSPPSPALGEGVIYGPVRVLYGPVAPFCQLFRTLDLFFRNLHPKKT